MRAPFLFTRPGPARGDGLAAHRRRRTAVGRLLVVALLFPVLGCTQTARIATVPTGAKVWINGELLGVSPTELTIENGPNTPFPSRLHARFERAGYEPLEVDLPSRVSGGRVAAAIFTLGIAGAVQGVRTVRPSYVYTLYPIVSKDVDISDEWIQGLRKLDRLRKDGLLSEAEYERRRSILLRDTPEGTGELGTH